MSRARPAAAAAIGVTSLAMAAFAANSVLGRLGLVEGGIGPGSFALIRLVSGALLLCLLAGPRRSLAAASPAGALALFAYAAFFSYAYLALAAGTGALILFAMVQATMVGVGLASGERLSGRQWGGLALALAGLASLLAPGLAAPSPAGALAMAVAGAAWGAYSLLGRGKGDPVARTAGNFLGASLIALPALPLALLVHPEPQPAIYGIALAVLSGAVTSGLGYAVWYAALKHLAAVQAGMAQLAVPAIASLGGVLVLAEPFTLRFALATLAILGGVGLATLTRGPARPN